MNKWTEAFDMSSIPDDVFRSEHSRRAAKKRRTYTGGVLWSRHNPAVAACRCADCTQTRAITRAHQDRIFSS